MQSAALKGQQVERLHPQTHLIYDNTLQETYILIIWILLGASNTSPASSRSPRLNVPVLLGWFVRIVSFYHLRLRHGPLLVVHSHLDLRHILLSSFHYASSKLLWLYLHVANVRVYGMH